MAETSEIRLIAKARFWLSVAFGLAGIGWFAAMYLNHFAAAADLKTYQNQTEDKWNKLNDKLDSLMDKVDTQQTRFDYLEKDVDYLKTQTYENGKATRAKLLKPPKRGE